MSALSVKCGCVVYDRSKIYSRLDHNSVAPCLKFDVEYTHDYISRNIGFCYRGQSIYNIAEELNKCVDYVFYHFTHDLETMNQIYADNKVKRLRKEVRKPLDKIPFLFEYDSLWNSRIRAVLSDIDGYDFCISPAELMELNGLSVEKLHKIFKALKVDYVVDETSKLHSSLEDRLVCQLQQSDHWIQYNQGKPFYDTSELPLTIDKRSMTHEQEKDWILRKILPWFNNELEAMSWFENDIIASLGSRTPEWLLNNGKFEALKYYIKAIELSCDA